MHAGQRMNVCIACTRQCISEAVHFASAWLFMLLMPTRYICLNYSLTDSEATCISLDFSLGKGPVGQTPFLLCLCLCLPCLCLCLLLCFCFGLCHLLWSRFGCFAGGVVVAANALEVAVAAWASVHGEAVPVHSQSQCAVC